VKTSNVLGFILALCKTKNAVSGSEIITNLQGSIFVHALNFKARFCETVAISLREC